MLRSESPKPRTQAEAPTIRELQDAAPTVLRYAGRTIRLKWHKLKRHPDDPPFARRNLRAGLAAGASLEVDIRPLACGHFVCLHDARLEEETTGHGLVADVEASAIRLLEMRDADGEPPLLMDEIAATMRNAPIGASALVQLDLQATSAEIDATAISAFASAVAGLEGRFILNGYDWDAVTRIGGGIPGLALGYDPIEDARTGDPGLARLIREKAPEAHTIYLYRNLVRDSYERDDGLVADLHEHGYQVDCWTIDHGTPGADRDLVAAIMVGCDQITTNTADAWAARSTSPSWRLT